MKNIKIICVFLLVIFSFQVFFGEEENKIIFKWAFIKKSNGSAESIDFTKDVSFKKEEKLKIIINPVKNAFVYLFYIDNKNEISLVFPESFDKEYKLGKTYKIPENETEWLSFDEEHGLDKFYLIASYTKQAKLENLTKEFIKISENKKSSPDSINSAKKNLLDEILSLRTAYSKFTVFAEKPTSIAGTSRGAPNKSEKENKEILTLVEADKFYAKILRINH